MTIKYHNLNGTLTPVEEAQIFVNDVGLLRGYGIFDFFPIRHGYPVFVEDYFDRFYRSADLMDLEVPVSREALLARVVNLAASNGLSRGYTKLVLTGGYAADGYHPGPSNLFVLQHADVHYPSQMYTAGVRLLLQRFTREHPVIKTLNYINVLQHRQVLKEAGALDLLYHDGRWISETSRANFFVVDDQGVLHTSQAMALGGISRKHLIVCAREQGYTVAEGPIAIDQLPTVGEAFLTSTTKGVLPVTKINDLVIGSGRVGPVTVALAEHYVNYVEQWSLARASA